MNPIEWPAKKRLAKGQLADKCRKLAADIRAMRNGRCWNPDDVFRPTLGPEAFLLACCVATRKPGKNNSSIRIGRHVPRAM